MYSNFDSSPPTPTTEDSAMNAFLKRTLLATATVAAIALTTTAASAHTVAIGWSKGAAVGSVNLFMGSYHQDGVGDGPDLEGAAHLIGPGAFDTLVSFTTAYTSGALPALLPSANVQYYQSYTLANMNSWEAVTIFGLNTAGTYTFGYVNAPNGSAHWSPFINTTSFNLTANDIGGGGTSVSQGVPEPVSVALMGLGLAGLGFSRRKKAQKAG
jgi:hypothetical protein